MAIVRSTTFSQSHNETIFLIYKKYAYSVGYMTDLAAVCGVTGVAGTKIKLTWRLPVE